MAPNLGTLLGAVVQIDDTLEDLNKPVSAGAYSVKPLSVDSGDHDVNVFGTPLTLQAGMSAKAEILDSTVTVPMFDDTPAVTAPAGTSFARLTVEGSVSAKGSASGHVSSVKISADASSSAKFSYVHARPVSGTRLDALTTLVKTTRLPQMADVTTVVPAELLSFDGTLNVDLGVQAALGGQVDIQKDLADVINLGADLSLPMKAHAQYTINASVGFSLYEETHVRLAGVAHHANWVRARVERAHRDEITFGVAITLDVDYDLKTGALLLLDKIFARIPWPELSASATEVLQLFATGNWAEVTSKISNRAADLVVKLVGDTGWKQWLSNSPEVAQFIKLSNFVVNEFNTLDGKITSLWRELVSRLGGTELVQFRALLKKIADIDLESIDASKLVGDYKEVLQLIETLSGRDLEEMIVSDGLGNAVKKAKDLAAKLNGMIDRVDGFGDKAVAWLQGFEQRTGITDVIAWLGTNATSVQALQKAGDAWIASIVERLVSKELGKINAADLAKLQAWARKAQKLLDAKDTILDKLKTATNKLQGHFGVKLTLEMSRVSESASLVDVEVDPKNGAAAKALTDFLASGDVAVLVQSLIDLNPKDPAADKPYAINEIVLTSRHVRTSTSALFLSFLGTTTTREARIDESIVRVTGDPVGRTGLYSGGASVRQQEGTSTAEGSAWVRIEAESKNQALDAPYDSVRQSIRLAFVREDTNTNQTELTWMDDLLSGLGFPVFGASVAGQQTRFSMEIDLPAAALQAFVPGDEKKWNADVLDTGKKWFGDPQGGVTQYVPVLNNADFLSGWTGFHMGGSPFDTVGKQLQIFEPDGPAVRPRIGFEGLFTFIRLRSRNRFDGVKGYNLQLATSKSPADLTTAMVNGAAMFDTHGTDSPIPLLNLWLVLKRVSADPNALKARGLATLRFRTDDKAAWSDVQNITLPGTGLTGFSLP
jgi:hypothetical protein